MIIGGGNKRGQKNKLITELDDAGVDVAGLIVPPDVFDHLAEELSEIALRSEQGKPLSKGQLILVGMDIMCDRRGVLPPDIFAIMTDKNNHPVRLIHRDEAVAVLQ